MHCKAVLIIKIYMSIHLWTSFYAMYSLRHIPIIVHLNLNILNASSTAQRIMLNPSQTTNPFATSKPADVITSSYTNILKKNGKLKQTSKLLRIYICFSWVDDRNFQTLTILQETFKISISDEPSVLSHHILCIGFNRLKNFHLITKLSPPQGGPGDTWSTYSYSTFISTQMMVVFQHLTPYTFFKQPSINLLPKGV